MSKNRKQYDQEFKIMTLELSKTRSNIVLLAKELELVRRFCTAGDGSFFKVLQISFAGNDNVVRPPEQEEIYRLKKDVQKLQTERDILKKAVGIFSSSDNKYSGS